jgi:hypothetical protein
LFGIRFRFFAAVFGDFPLVNRSMFWQGQEI